MNKIAIPIIAISIVVGATPFLLDEMYISQEEQLTENMTAEVVDAEVFRNGTRVGIDPGNNLDFGEIETGIRVTKFLNYDSSGEKRLVKIDVTGNISERINYTEKQWIEGEKRISIAFKSQEPGLYSGELSVKTFTPEGDIGRKWLELKSEFY